MPGSAVTSPVPEDMPLDSRRGCAGCGWSQSPALFHTADSGVQELPREAERPGERGCFQGLKGSCFPLRGQD